MSNTELKPEFHWLVNLAQELRDDETMSLTPKSAHLDPDLANPAVSALCDFADRCGSDIQPEFFRGYAYGLRLAGLIDDVVMEKVERHIRIVDRDPTPYIGGKTRA